MIKIIETVRDGFQGIGTMIPTPKKIEFINILLKAGFEAVDLGSFVSKTAIPQMADTAEVIKCLDFKDTKSKLMVLVANRKGAELASEFEEIDQLIYPFSVSETFLKKNINADFGKAENQIDEILNVCLKSQKELIVYLSMAFGNPYSDPWSLDIIHEWIRKLANKGIRIIPLSDITGESTPKNVQEVFSSIIPAYPKIEFGFHLHANPNEWQHKIDVAYQSGCRRFDSVLGGLGGCPMTGYELLANVDTHALLRYFNDNGLKTCINENNLLQAKILLDKILIR